MVRHNQAPQITELDRMLLHHRGWSFSETQEDILGASEPHVPGTFRIAMARWLRTIANWAEGDGRHARTIPGRSA